MKGTVDFFVEYQANESYAPDMRDYLIEVDDVSLKETILDKGIMPSEKVLDFPVDCNTLTGSVNL